MSIAITGAEGFLGWHLRCAWRAVTGTDAVVVKRADWSSPEALDARLAGVDAVIHVAGTNRGTDAEIRAGNEDLAALLAASLVRLGRGIHVVFANSIHAHGSTVFGESKRRSAVALASSTGATGGMFVDVVLPNLFGEHGRPHYNSFVSTFCTQLAHGEQPSVTDDRELALLHAQDAVDVLIAAVSEQHSTVIEPAGRPVLISDVLTRLSLMADAYADGVIPDIADPFDRALFNTYRSFIWPQRRGVSIVRHSDDRGALAEFIRARGGEAQAFFSTTQPAQVRGNHFHRRKVERFLVVSGTGTIALRRMFTSEVVSIDVNGEDLLAVDMPTLWTHNITNTGIEPMTTLFYTDELLRPEAPDTFSEQV